MFAAYSIRFARSLENIFPPLSVAGAVIQPHTRLSRANVSSRKTRENNEGDQLLFDRVRSHNHFKASSADEHFSNLYEEWLREQVALVLTKYS